MNWRAYLLPGLVFQSVVVGGGYGLVQAAESVERVGGNLQKLEFASRLGLTDAQREAALDSLAPLDDEGDDESEALERREKWEKRVNFVMEQRRKHAERLRRAESGEPPLPADEFDADDEILASVVARLVEWVEENRGSLGRRAVGGGLELIAALVSGITTIGMLGFGVFLTTFFFFFFSSRYPATLEIFRGLIPDGNRERVLYLVGRMDGVIAGFIRGRLIIMLIQQIVFAIGYLIIGVPAAILVGLGVGLLSIVPYLALIGIPVSIILMVLADAEGFRGELWWILLAPTAWYFLVQALDDYVLTPNVQGKTTDMDTPTVLFSSIAGGLLLGVYGLLIAIPLAACIKILILEVLLPRYRAWARGETADPLPLAASPEDQ
jgi:predicted PurR-regulated permease PerM